MTTTRGLGRAATAALLLLAAGCPHPQPPPVGPVQPVQPIAPVQPVQPVQPVEPVQPVQPVEPVQPVSECDRHLPLRVRFYDVAQALAVLVTLPDGRTILVDTGDWAEREKCGPSCKQAHDHLVARLKSDLPNQSIDLMWITHQHSDHLGGAEDLIKNFKIASYVDNGLDPARPQTKATHDAASAAGVAASAVDPDHKTLPLADTESVHLEPLVPPRWPQDCPANANDCSIGLRIDYCASSMLFTGDAERTEEDAFTVRAATLLQLGHHGSDTSSTDSFIQRVAPKYAVISAGKPREGTNRSYCHPRKSVVDRLTAALGDSDGQPLVAFDAAVKCGQDAPGNWPAVPTSAKLWATERDGDVVLVTTGDGTFTRELPPPTVPSTPATTTTATPSGAPSSTKSAPSGTPAPSTAPTHP